MTHALKLLWNRNLLALAAFAAVMAPQALKADTAQCQLGNSIMDGTYLMSFSGTIAGTGAGTGPITGVGLVTYDGQGGGLTGPTTSSVNGMVSRDPGGTKATYTVNRDCTGSKQFADGSHFDFVITPDGSVITWVETDTGVTLSGTAVRLKK